jgi:probable HAF family extracellular repeat protein
MKLLQPRAIFLRTIYFALHIPWLLGGRLTWGAEVRYLVVNLQANPAMQVRASGARSINSRGDVAGWYFLPGDDHAKPFAYEDGTGFVALEGLNGGAAGINSNGQVAVFGYVPGTESPTAWRYTPGIGFESLGTLGEPGDIGDVPNGINNFGQVVGRSDTVHGTRPWQDAFLYTDGVGMVNLGSLGPDQYGTATAINDLGQITGHSGGYAFLYAQETGMISIGQGSGYAINNRGVVAGKVGWGPPYEAVIFEDGVTRRLGNLGGETWANGINDHRVVVGTTWPVRSGFVWTEAEGMVRLDALIEPGWFIYDVWAINNSGQIAGEANGVAVRLDPISPKLDLQLGATNVVVSWSPAWPGLVLEATDSLSTPSWQPVDTRGTNVVRVPLDSPQRYFRLNLDGIRGLCCPPQ